MALPCDTGSGVLNLYKSEGYITGLNFNQDDEYDRWFHCPVSV